MVEKCVVCGDPESMIDEETKLCYDCFVEAGAPGEEE